MPTRRPAFGPRDLAMIAQAFATMAGPYPGRVVLGLGTGEALNETAVTGAQWSDLTGRFARMREAVRLMGRLWTEDGAKRWIIASDPNEAVAQVKPYVDAGLNGHEAAICPRSGGPDE
jgi:hypothetical protein